MRTRREVAGTLRIRAVRFLAVVAAGCVGGALFILPIAV